jgi:hypothetical protein
MSWLIQWLYDAFHYITDFFTYYPRVIFHEFLQALASFFIFIFPSWVSDSITYIPTLYSSFPSGVTFWLQFFKFEYGIPLICSAFLVRFILRHLPFIGG